MAGSIPPGFAPPIVCVAETTGLVDREIAYLDQQISTQADASAISAWEHEKAQLRELKPLLQQVESRKEARSAAVKGESAFDNWVRTSAVVPAFLSADAPVAKAEQAAHDATKAVDDFRRDIPSCNRPEYNAYFGQPQYGTIDF